MTGSNEDDHSQKLQSKIGEILMHEWDPIGIKDEPKARHEYEAYVERVYALLADRNRSSDKITAYLLDVCSRRMGLKITAYVTERSRRAAESLIVAWTESGH